VGAERRVRTFKNASPRSRIGRAMRRLLEVLLVDRSEVSRQLLDFTQRFPAYSPRNSLLIAFQRPGAVLVRGKRAWERLGCSVREGARSIGVVAPALDAGDRRGTSFFKVRRVYDAADLEGPPPALPPLAPPPADPSGRAERLVEALESWIRGSGLTLVEGSPRANRHCWGATNGMVVWVQPHLRGAARAAVLAHEIAHVRLHYRFDRGRVLVVDGAEDRTEKTLKELEAELTAFLVLAIHGIDASGGAGMYLAQWEASREAVEAKFPVALDAAASIAGQMRRRRYRRLVAAAGSTSAGLRDYGPSTSREAASRSNPLARRPVTRAAPRLFHPPSPATSHIYVHAART